MNKRKLLPFIFATMFTISACSSNNNQEDNKKPQIPDPTYDIPEDEEIDSSITANDAQFDVSNVEEIEGSVLKNKKIYWLGSSVTYGASSSGQSMADFISKRSGCISVKEAVSGTTLLNDGLTDDTGKKSYVNRLKTTTLFDTKEEVDAFVCQISTNDCTSARLSKRGEITADDKRELEDFNVATTLGAVEYIISYVVDTWGCPVYFYSGSYFGDGSNKYQRQNSNPKGSDYSALINQVKQIAEKRNKFKFVDVKIIDMYNDEEFNELASEKYYSWAMNDPIHPKKAGYLQWRTPYIQHFLEKDFIENY